MDMDSESDKVSAAAAATQEKRERKEERMSGIAWGGSIKDSEELKDMILNRFSSLSRRDQFTCLAAACFSIYRVGVHNHPCEGPSFPTSILEDDARKKMLAGREHYLTKLQKAMLFQPKSINKSDDQGACSETIFHQSDDQNRKEMLEKKATKKRFPDFVW